MSFADNAAVTNLTTEQLEAGLDPIRSSPSDQGTLDMIVCRPETDQRKICEFGELSTVVGLVGDNWKVRGSKSTEDGSANPQCQLTVINVRSIELMAGPDRNRWAIAGDQLYVDYDISEGNAPAGTRLQIGSAVIEISEKPHTGCAKFSQRFGADALRMVNSPDGRFLRMRGVNARVVEAGAIATGDAITKL